VSEEKTMDSYEVGYGKPPKNTQFQKGISGNPRGRPKKSLDFDHELIRESKSFMTINENGRRKRISKHGVAVKQLVKQAITGSTQALKNYFALLQQAHERVALVAGPQHNNSGKYDAVHLTDEELMRIAAAGLEKAE
jgi:Family of unknown function (DUF5681)